MATSWIIHYSSQLGITIFIVLLGITNINYWGLLWITKGITMDYYTYIYSTYMDFHHDMGWENTPKKYVFYEETIGEHTILWRWHILSHRIHGAGIYANMTGVHWWDPCYHIKQHHGSYGFLSWWLHFAQKKSLITWSVCRGMCAVPNLVHTTYGILFQRRPLA
jgi:hypothetical protein